MTTFDVARQALTVLIPELIVVLAATAMMTAGAFVRLPRRTWAAFSAATLAVAVVALILVRHVVPDPYASVVLNDPLSGYARLALLLTGLVVLAFAHDQVDDARASEFFGCLLMIDAGAMLVCAANEMVFLFAGLELVSIPTYLLLYLPRRNRETQEAATKYFFLSIFSSAFLLFGLAYLYGLTGLTNLRALAWVLEKQVQGEAVAKFGTIAVVFIMAGLGFRVAAVPFHFYAPDVYQGSPTVVAAVLAWVPKGIGFVAMIRALTAVLPVVGDVASKGLLLAWVLAAMTMILGNAVALLQNDLKRLLAYSSIAHAGYLLIGVAVAFTNRLVGYPQGGGLIGGAFSGTEGILFYLAAYALMTLGAFGVIISLSSPERPVETVDDLAGLGRTHPAAALAMAFCLFSLAGVPPMAGFWGKLWIFSSAFLPVQGEDGGPSLRWLAILGVLNAAAGAYYYLRIVVWMYFQPVPARPLSPRSSWPTTVAVGACATLSLALGLYPRPLARASHEAAVAATARPGPARAPADQPAGPAVATTRGR
ncbi:MAG TPA: NADH-quinone oxidoreductase subunit N [Isosphaeraceae bacterium]|jgi:NADH-quinone oxidoreductase subunit N|nr:NADH-quinone oxidoreductase subunit N [Isosphaeraceae bacterium]